MRVRPRAGIEQLRRLLEGVITVPVMCASVPTKFALAGIVCVAVF